MSGLNTVRLDDFYWRSGPLAVAAGNPNPSLRVLLTIGIPTLLVLVQAFYKKLVRGTPFQVRDWYFGIDLAFANLSAGLIETGDLALRAAPSNPAAFGYAAVYTGFAVVGFLIVMWLHQDFDTDTNGAPKPFNKKQLLALGIIGNGFSLALLLAFLLYVKPL